jgi:hypothetical protein
MLHYVKHTVLFSPHSRRSPAGKHHSNLPTPARANDSSFLIPTRQVPRDPSMPRHNKDDEPRKTRTAAPVTFRRLVRPSFTDNYFCRAANHG